MATIVTKSVTIKTVHPVTGVISGTGREWVYTTEAERNDLAATVFPEQRMLGAIVYDRTTTLDTTTGAITTSEIPLVGRDEREKTVVGPAWAWYLLLARLKHSADPVSQWLYEAIEAQTDLTLEYTP